ncbi:hypothetical protein A9Q87_06110 [Flavobacteriales bacterium 34_180_T64]|nr:hypothetical protein A9Q87_06110 [Flavobacteriales bacterium 34_180_T64]
MGQNYVLCSIQNDYVIIESTDNIPAISDNGDGTITLTHQDQNITDIFAEYTIYNFYQAFPESNGELFKYYVISHGNKTLLNTLYNDVSSDIFFIDQEYPSITMSSNLINLLHNKTYKLIKYCSNIPEDGQYCEDNEQNIPDGFELKIAFNYDINDDIMYAESVGLSPCGNSFSIGLKGGHPDFNEFTNDKLQLWKSTESVSSESNFSDPCHYIEEMLYSMLDIGCLEFHVGNLIIYNGIENGQIILERETGIFSTDFMTFENHNLSINESTLRQIKLFQLEANPYLQISGLENQLISIEIFNVSGQRIVSETPFEINSINISKFKKGLYFIKLSTSNNQQSVVKFLKK